jgi:hypothetical protein
MFRAHPFWFVLAVVLIAAFGVGIIILLYWYIKTHATTLIVTEHELMYEKGILSKDRLSGESQARPVGLCRTKLRQPHSRRRHRSGLDRRR